MNAITKASLHNDGMYVSLVPHTYINHVWDEIKGFLESAVSVTNGRYTTYDVYNGCQLGEYQLWIAFGDDDKIVGVEVTSISNYPSKRVLTSLFTGGIRIRTWRDKMMELITRFARDNGCEAIEGFGRSGWVKLLEPYGVRQMTVMFERDI